MTTVLLTGASGYIAKHIVVQLLEAGYHVRASVRSDARANEVAASVRGYFGSNEDALHRLQFVLLDLNDDAGWTQAATGVDAIIHSASPFVIDSPKDAEVLIRPAVDGTLRALRAAHEAGVTRVVLTSSTVAVWGSPAGMSTGFDESMWTDLDAPLGRDPYNRSKTLAEQAAWSYVATEAPEIRLTAINPGVVLGAPLDEHYGTSVALVERVLAAKDPALPDLGFPIVDVKDVARLHVAALTTPASEGERFLAVAGTLRFIDIARLLQRTFPSRRFVTRIAPNFVVRILALFDRTIRGTLPILGQNMQFSNAKALEVFGGTFIAPEVSVIETAHFLVERG
jgi:dihydroflavonol-4-reductase